MSSGHDDREAAGSVLDYAAPTTAVRERSTGTGIVAALVGLACAFLVLLLYVADPLRNPDITFLAGLLLAVCWPLFTITALVVSVRRLRSQPIKPPQRRLAKIALAITVISLLGLMVAIFIGGRWVHRAHHQMACHSNLRNVGQALLMYAHENENHLPSDLSTLVRQNLIPLEMLRCSRAADPAFTFTADTTDEDLLRAGATDYIYLGAAYKTVPKSYEIPLVIELPGRHGDGMIVLFADGHQQVLSRQEGAALLARHLRSLQPAPAADADPPALQP